MMNVGGAANTTFKRGGDHWRRRLIKDGAGTLNLNFNNTYTGATAISAGTLALGAATATSSSIVANASNLTLTANSAVAAMTGAGTTTLGANTLTIGTATNASSQYDGVISGTAASPRPAPAR